MLLTYQSSRMAETTRFYKESMWAYLSNQLQESQLSDLCVAFVYYVWFQMCGRELRTVKFDKRMYKSHTKSVKRIYML